MKRGDRKEQQSLCRAAQALQQELRTILGRYADSPVERDDLLQETFERLLSPGLSQSVGKPDNYVRRAARRIGVDGLRKRFRRDREMPLDNVPESQLSLDHSDPFELLAEEQEQEILENIRDNKLPPRCRTIYELRRAGLSNPEIARRLGIEISTVKNQMSVALKVFARELARLGDKIRSGRTP